MKKTIIIISSFLLLSCTNKVEDMLIEFQKNNILASGLAIDFKKLNTKLISSEKVQDITNADSLAIIQNLAEENLQVIYDRFETKNLDSINNRHIKLKKTIKIIGELAETFKKSDPYSKLHMKYKRDFESGQSILKNSEILFNKKEEYNKLIAKFSENPTKILSYKYLVKYSFVNTFNNIDQEKTQYFFTNAENTKFVKSQKVE